MLNGRTIIELTDVKTGVTEKIEKTNMVTNAINSYFKDNSLGFRDTTSSTYFVEFRRMGKFEKPSESTFSFGKNVSVLGCLIGGVLCYSSPLEENADNFYAPLTNELVACANIEKNTYDELTKRGSFNAIESGETDKGYKFVWDFATHQGNGTISALGLTSYWGGINGFQGYPFFNLSFDKDYVLQNDAYFQKGYFDIGKKAIYIKRYIIEFDPQKNIGISIGVVKKGDTNVITIWKVKLSITKRRLKFGYLSDKEFAETYEIPTTDPGVENFCTLLKDSNFMFADGKDGYWYGLSSDGGSYTRWIKIKKDDYSVTVGEWDSLGFQNGSGKILNNFSDTISYYSSMIIKDNYIYIKTGSGLYIVNKDTGVVVSKETSACRNHWIDMLGAVWNYGSYNYYNFRFYNYYTSSISETARTSFLIGTSKYNNNNINNLESKIYNIPLFRITNSVFIHGFIGFYPATVLVTPYLATINNLQEPVTKTADKTMKITYILEEEDE